MTASRLEDMHPQSPPEPGLRSNISGGPTRNRSREGSLWWWACGGRGLSVVGITVGAPARPRSRRRSTASIRSQDPAQIARLLQIASAVLAPRNADPSGEGGRVSRCESQQRRDQRHVRCVRRCMTGRLPTRSRVHHLLMTREPPGGILASPQPPRRRAGHSSGRGAHFPGGGWTATGVMRKPSVS